MTGRTAIELELTTTYPVDTTSATKPDEAVRSSSDRFIRRQDFIETTLLDSMRIDVLDSRDQRQQFWDTLFGNYLPDWRDYYDDSSSSCSGHRVDGEEGFNPRCDSLTYASLEVILKYHALLASQGLDFRHLPSGFFLRHDSVNPSGKRVLDYSTNFAQLCPQSSPFALTLASEVACATTEDQPFLDSYTDEQKVWYRYLASAPAVGHGCSRQALQATFAAFVAEIRIMGLDWPPAAKFADNSCPIDPRVKMSQWLALLHNSALPLSDRQFQFDQLPLLTLHRNGDIDRLLERRPSFIIEAMKPRHALTKQGYKSWRYTGLALARESSRQRETFSTGNPIAPSIRRSIWHDLFENDKAQPGLPCSARLWRLLSSRGRDGRGPAAQYWPALQQLQQSIDENLADKTLDQYVYATFAGKVIPRAVRRSHAYIRREMGALSDALFKQTVHEVITTVNATAAFAKGLEGQANWIESYGVSIASQLLHKQALQMQNLYLEINTTFPTGVDSWDIYNPFGHLEYEKTLQICELQVRCDSPAVDGARFYFSDGQWQRDHGMNFSCYGSVYLALTLTLLGEQQRSLVDFITNIHSTGQYPSAPYKLVGRISRLISHFNIKTEEEAKAIATVFRLAIDELQQAPAYTTYHNKLRKLSVFVDVLDDMSAQMPYKQALTLVRELPESNELIEVIDYLKHRVSQYFPTDYFVNLRQRLDEQTRGLSVRQKQLLERYDFSSRAKALIIDIESALVSRAMPGDSSDDQLNALNVKFQRLLDIVGQTEFEGCLEELARVRGDIPYDWGLVYLLDYLIADQSCFSFVTACSRQRHHQEQREGSSSSSAQQRTFMAIKHYVLNHRQVMDNAAVKETVLTPQQQYEWLADIMFCLTDAPRQPKNRWFVKQLKELADLVSAQPAAIAYLQEITAYVSTAEKITALMSALGQISELVGRHSRLFHDTVLQYRYDPEQLLSFWQSINALKGADTQHKCLWLANYYQQDPQIDRLPELFQLVKVLDSESLKQLDSPLPCLERLISYLQGDNFLGQLNGYQRSPYTRQVPVLKQTLDHWYRYCRLAKDFYAGDSFDGLTCFTGEVWQFLSTALANNRQLSRSELKSRLQEHKRALTSATDDTVSDLKRQIFCLVVEMLARTSYQQEGDNRQALDLHLNQLMALYLAHFGTDEVKVVNQLHTGGGKTLFNMVSCAYLALIDDCNKVYSYTTDLPLAERDYARFREFFAAMGLETCLYTLDTPAAAHNAAKVIFTDRAQFTLGHLRHLNQPTEGPHALAIPPARHCAVVIDEYDSFLNGNICNLAQTDSEMAAITWVYEPLVQYFELEKEAASRDAFIQLLHRDGVAAERVGGLTQLLEKYPHLFEQWRVAAREALMMKEGRDFVLDPKKSSVRDAKGQLRYHHALRVLREGRIVPGVFADSVQQCLCALINLKAKQHRQLPPCIISPETTCVATSIPRITESHFQAKCICTSATAGCEVANKDPQTSGFHFRTPSEQPSRLEEAPAWLTRGHEQHQRKLAELVKQQIAAGNAVLLICEDEPESKALLETMRADPQLTAMDRVIHWQRIEAHSTLAERKAVIQHAGQSDYVTISTSAFGRGTDVLPGQDVSVTVIQTFFSDSDDLESQIKGRTARNGAPGLCLKVYDLERCPPEIRQFPANQARLAFEHQQHADAERAFDELEAAYGYLIDKLQSVFHQKIREPASTADEVKQLGEHWQTTLKQLQAEWVTIRGKQAQSGDELEKLQTFKQDFGRLLDDKLPSAVKGLGLDEGALRDDINQKLKSTCQSVDNRHRFFQQRGKEYQPPRYDGWQPSGAGQYTRYLHPCAKWWPSLTLQRPLGDDISAYADGRGSAWPELMAVLSGEKMPFEDLIAYISYLVESMCEYLCPTDPNAGLPAMPTLVVGA